MITAFLNSPFLKSFTSVSQDLFRDSNSKKISLTRILATIMFGMIIWIHVVAIGIMIEKKEVDHALLFEDFSFVGSILISKNYINRNNIEKKPEQA